METALAKVRLFVSTDLSLGGNVTLSRDQSHYVTRVMRQGMGDKALLFNGIDGEWLAVINDASKVSCKLELVEQRRDQGVEPDIWVVFAPIKKTRLDFLVEKATELGASRLMPVLTRRTDVSRVNTDRLLATATESAEQCERLIVPQVAEPVDFRKLIKDWPQDRQLYLMDETGQGQPATRAFANGKEANTTPPRAAIMVGPEGGFSPEELDALRNLPFVTPVTLGARILRAETAVVAALSNWQLLSGDGCATRDR